MEVKGHALCPSGGDIVCAAVSILTQTVLFAGGFTELETPAMIKNGYLLKISSPAEIDKEKEEKCFLLLETMLLGLKEDCQILSPPYRLY